MADEDIEDLIRTAQLEGGGAAWVQAGSALSRAGRWDEAAHALVQAGAQGEATGELFDRLAPDDLNAFELRTPSEQPQKLYRCTWSHDGRLYVSGQDLFTWDAGDSGLQHIGKSLDDFTLGIAPSLEQAVVGYFYDGGGIYGSGGLAIQHLGKGKLFGWEDFGEGFRPRKLVWPGSEPEILMDLGYGASAWRMDPDRPFPRGDFRQRGTAEQLWKLPSDYNRAGVDLSGRVVGATRRSKGNRLAFFHPLRESEALATLELERDLFVLLQEGLWALCDRALVVLGHPPEQEAVLFDAGGELRATVVKDSYDFTPSPSGRHFAIRVPSPEDRNEKTAQVALLDTHTGDRRTFRLEDVPIKMTWSPSGRRLAIIDNQGSLSLLEA